MPRVHTFDLDTSVVARRIYRNYTHETTVVGATIETTVCKELSEFLHAYLAENRCSEHVFLRVDAFVDADSLRIIEVNAELQDGWGVALNLLRASGNVPQRNRAPFPTEIIVYYEDYLPEFELAREEFRRLGHEMQIVSWRKRPGVLLKNPLDDKMCLARFSRLWQGSRVRIPRTYWNENTVWEDLPDDVIFKFRHKYGTHSRKAGFSVARRSDIGNGKYIRRCYAKGDVIAQERILPFTTADGSVTQAIILCSGYVPVTGYLQVAPQGTFIINDKTAQKGPLVLE